MTFFAWKKQKNALPTIHIYPHHPHLSCKRCPHGSRRSTASVTRSNSKPWVIRPTPAPQSRAEENFPGNLLNARLRGTTTVRTTAIHVYMEGPGGGMIGLCIQRSSPGCPKEFIVTRPTEDEKSNFNLTNLKTTNQITHLPTQQSWVFISCKSRQITTSLYNKQTTTIRKSQNYTCPTSPVWPKKKSKLSTQKTSPRKPQTTHKKCFGQDVVVDQSKNQIIKSPCFWERSASKKSADSLRSNGDVSTCPSSTPASVASSRCLSQVHRTKPFEITKKSQTAIALKVASYLCFI